MAMLCASLSARGLASWLAPWMAGAALSNVMAAARVLCNHSHACGAHWTEVPTFADTFSVRKAYKNSLADGHTGQRLAIVWLTQGWIISAALAESDGVAMAAAYHP